MRTGWLATGVCLVLAALPGVTAFHGWIPPSDAELAAHHIEDTSCDLDVLDASELDAGELSQTFQTHFKGIKPVLICGVVPSRLKRW